MLYEVITHQQQALAHAALAGEGVEVAHLLLVDAGVGDDGGEEHGAGPFGERGLQQPIHGDGGASYNFV